MLILCEVRDIASLPVSLQYSRESTTKEVAIKYANLQEGFISLDDLRQGIGRGKYLSDFSLVFSRTLKVHIDHRHLETLARFVDIADGKLNAIYPEGEGDVVACGDMHEISKITQRTDGEDRR